MLDTSSAEMLKTVLDYPLAKRTKKDDQYGKKYRVCPYCGDPTAYDFYGSRWKSCRKCLVNNRIEQQIAALKWQRNRGHKYFADDALLRIFYHYVISRQNHEQEY